MFSKNNTTQDFRAKCCAFCVKDTFIPRERGDDLLLLILTTGIFHRRMHFYQIILLYLIKAKFTYTFYCSHGISRCRKEKLNVQRESMQPQKEELSVQWGPHSLDVCHTPT